MKVLSFVGLHDPDRPLYSYQSGDSKWVVDCVAFGCCWGMNGSHANTLLMKQRKNSKYEVKWLENFQFYPPEFFYFFQFSFSIQFCASFCDCGLSVISLFANNDGKLTSKIFLFHIV